MNLQTELTKLPFWDKLTVAEQANLQMFCVAYGEWAIEEMKKDFEFTIKQNDV